METTIIASNVLGTIQYTKTSRLVFSIVFHKKLANVQKKPKLTKYLLTFLSFNYKT